ncbi:helix-turn-helix domain-containing protein [Paractinoplanes durhamensis]|uniref:HTH cro/C1-type domain-containing protein n=1 Tax=Paractinoplanes durhamensis TaxID=113563 RepID=A0ABQ3YY01_9ACTN|nr:helix-turn-helix transcriptional regulator [Actinoplanes durhamensis]GIE02443.1 hypothetical protein Adu01nite_37930 [Actinoplanes durhamensis]
MKTIDQVIEERKQTDPDFADEWDRGAFAREVALAMVRYRTEQQLSQRDLAKQTGLKQPVIARLETGEHPPSLMTLAKLTRATGLEFRIEITQGGVAMPQRRLTFTARYRCKMSFDVRNRDDSRLTSAELASAADALTAELHNLEECNESMRDSVVFRDAEAGTVTVAITVIADDEPGAAQFTSDVCRTAIHATGGSTPGWSSDSEGPSSPDFRPTDLHVKNAA